MHVKKSALDRDSVQSSSSSSPKFVERNGFDNASYEPLVDALVYEPIPYRSAVKEGATHVLVLRTRPDGSDVSGKSSILDKLIVRRFFMRKNKFPRVFKRLRTHLHKKRYAEDVLILNKAAKDERDYRDTTQSHLMAVALPPGSPGVGRLETGRKAIFEGVRRGFARTYDALVEDPNERGRGEEVAKLCFPDEILDYDPREFQRKEASAFLTYLDQMDESTIPFHWGKTATETGAPQ